MKYIASIIILAFAISEPILANPLTIVPTALNEAFNSIIGSADIHDSRDALPIYGARPSLNPYLNGLAAARIHSFLHNPSTNDGFYYDGSAQPIVGQMITYERDSPKTQRQNIFNRLSKKYGAEIASEIEMRLMSFTKEDLINIVEEAIEAHPTKGVWTNARPPSHSGVTIKGEPADPYGLTANINVLMWQRLNLSPATLASMQATAREVTNSTLKEISSWIYEMSTITSGTAYDPSQYFLSTSKAERSLERLMQGLLFDIEPHTPEHRVAREGLTKQIEDFNGRIKRDYEDLKEYEQEGNEGRKILILRLIEAKLSIINELESHLNWLKLEIQIPAIDVHTDPLLNGEQLATPVAKNSRVLQYALISLFKNDDYISFDKLVKNYELKLDYSMYSVEMVEWITKNKVERLFDVPDEYPAETYIDTLKSGLKVTVDSCKEWLLNLRN